MAILNTRSTFHQPGADRDAATPVSPAAAPRKVAGAQPQTASTAVSRTVAPKLAPAVTTPPILADIAWWITGALAVIVVMLAVSVASLIRAATGDLTMAWFISRGAGIASYLLIAGSMMYGLMITTKTATGAVPAPVTFSMHEFISWLGLVLGLAHAVVLMWDGYIKYTPVNILVPFNSEYRPVWVGIGQIAFYMCAIVVASFYAKKLIGHKIWRLIHYVSFLSYLMVTVHSIQAGSDTNTSSMQIMYIGSLAVILFLTIMRILTAKTGKGKAQKT